MNYDITPFELKLYNTATRAKEVLKPFQGDTIRMYTCGPTVYNFVHIGNYRTFIFEDLLRRTIKFFGMKIDHVMNLTDVDDKTIKGAVANKVTLDEYTRPFKDAFFNDLKILNIELAEHYPAATEYIKPMIKMIEALLLKGIAYYGGDGSVYFAIQKFPHYGCLSHLHLDELQTGASERVLSDEYDKDHAADFVLWKKYDPSRDGEVFWESPFGRGRPGWHLECSAMAMGILGETIDIHVGGIDNMFPHHENEIAQSEAYTGKQFVKLWMHAEHLVVDNRKMSKSAGNFYILSDLLKRDFTGPQIRYMLLHTHYKTQLNFTFAGLESIKNTLERLNDFVHRMQEVRNKTASGEAKPPLEKAWRRFAESLADDLNISSALAALFELIREINILCDAGKIGEEDACQVLELLRKFDAVLGVMDFARDNEAIPEEMHSALQQRIQARKDKNWALADSLRDMIASRGYAIEDTPAGARLKKI